MTRSTRPDPRWRAPALNEAAIPVEARLEAALLGALAGDALAIAGGGRGRALPASVDPDTGAARLGGETGQVSQRLLAAARALVTARGSAAGARGGHVVRQAACANWAFTELPLWGLHHRGGTTAELRMVSLLADGGWPWAAADAHDQILHFAQCDALAAVPSLAVAAFHAADPSPDAALEDALRFARATQGHPRAVVGASLMAFAAWSAARGVGRGSGLDLLAHVAASRADWETPPWERGVDEGAVAVAERLGDPVQGWREATESLADLLERIVRAVVRGEAEAETEASLLASAPAPNTPRAVALALHRVARATFDRAGTRGAELLVPRGTLRGDVLEGSAVAAMAGGLLGLLRGPGWLPAEWARVQDAELALGLAEDLASGAARYGPQPVTTADLARIRREVRNGALEVVLDGTRVLGVGQPPAVVTTALGDALRYRGVTSDGQRFDITLPVE
jgi:ADP-ribosylglycohydrolase